MNLKNITVSLVFCLTNVLGSSEINILEETSPSYNPMRDHALLNKDQQRELIKARERIQSYTVYMLNNYRDSIRFSLKTHSAEYTERQKAYKRLILWYIEEQLKVLSLI